MKKKKIIIYILAFIIPIIIFFGISQILGYYPNGVNVMRNHDAYVQYPAFFIALKDLALYSFKGALGFNFFTTATYYLMSPLNILLIFFSKANFEIFYLLITLIKIGLSGLTMSILLQSGNKNKTDWFTLVFTTAYSLCGFTTAYYYNTMWMDTIYMLPLVILSINKLIKGEKKYLYVITLSITVIINYYTGYMVCIFGLLYFIFKLINSKNINKKQAIKDFVMLSLLTGLISCVVLLPTLYSLMLGKVTKFSEDYTNYWEFNKNVFNIPYYLTPGSFYSGDQRTDGSAMIYSTLFCLLSFIMLFFNKKFNKKFKISLLIFIAIFIASFSFNLFDFAWQFFQKPIWFNHRYSFVFSFLIIYIGYKSFKQSEFLKLNLMNKTYIIFTFIIVILISFIVRFIKVGNLGINKYIFLIMSFLLIIFYVILIDRKKLIFLIIPFVILELSINSYSNLKSYSSAYITDSNQIYDEFTSDKEVDGITNISYEYEAQRDFNTIRSLNFISN